jgi:hypothetical protein
LLEEMVSAKQGIEYKRSTCDRYKLFECSAAESCVCPGEVAMPGLGNANAQESKKHNKIKTLLQVSVALELAQTEKNCNLSPYIYLAYSHNLSENNQQYLTYGSRT